MADDDDSEGVVERVKETAQETVHLSRGQYVLLLISAATGILSALAHGIQFLHLIGIL